jgi:adenosylcobinamide-GDP ribazoletransferase
MLLDPTYKGFLQADREHRMTTPGASLATDLKVMMSFCTRLPLHQAAPPPNPPPQAGEGKGGGDIARASWAFPIIGAVVGGAGALVYWTAFRIGLSPAPAAALVLAATLGVTGCLHEDGLADTVDGFGGGGDRARKLEIMRDSRLGTYGASALALSLLLRWSALAAIAEPGAVAMALVAAHGAARGVIPAFMWFVPPARRDGLSANAGRPPLTCVGAAALLGIGMLGLGLGLFAAAIGLLLLAAASLLMARLAMNQIGGQTGDVLGALEQAGEIVILLAAAAISKA